MPALTKAFSARLNLSPTFPPLAFERLAQIASTNGVTPTLRFTISGTIFGTVTGYSGFEAISKPHVYIIQGTAAGTIVDPATRIGATGQLEFTRNGKTTRFTGIITAFEYSSVDANNRLFIARLEPILSQLDLATDYRIFQQATVPDVVAAVYSAVSPNPPEALLSRSYSPRENVVQYAETTLNFLHRLLEHEGIFYFFDYNQLTPSLIIADNTAAYNAPGGAAIPYYGNAPAAPIPSGAEYIRTFQRASHLRSVRSVVRGYNFRIPGTLPTSTASSSSGFGEYYITNLAPRQAQRSRRLSRAHGNPVRM